MARRVSNLNLVESFSEFKEFKNINRPTMMKVLEDVFKTLLKKKYGTDDNFDIIVNTDKGDLEIWRRREIVEDTQVFDPTQQVGITKALTIEKDYEVGEELYEEIKIIEFGRRSILAARQTLISKIMELEKDELYKKYSDRVGEIINGEVYQIWKREILVLDDESNELILPRNEMIRSDFFKKGDSVRAIVKEVDLRNNSPIIRLSRTDNNFLAKLLELEVPEIFDGLIVIKRIVRQPGERAKVAVESYDERIDPVGACVGMKGSRIHGIVRELKNENIDIINYTANMPLFIRRCLTPARINSMDIDEDEKRVSVYLDPEEVSKAIGKKGVNINLASKMTGYTIDVYRDIDEIEEEDDILLEEFTDEIDEWVIGVLKSIGLDTARSVLNLERNEIIRRSDLEEETVDFVIKVLKEEFETEEDGQSKSQSTAKKEDKPTQAKTAEAVDGKPEEKEPKNAIASSEEMPKDITSESATDTEEVAEEKAENVVASSTVEKTQDIAPEGTTDKSEDTAEGTKEPENVAASSTEETPKDIASENTTETDDKDAIKEEEQPKDIASENTEADDKDVIKEEEPKDIVSEDTTDTDDEDAIKEEE